MRFSFIIFSLFLFSYLPLYSLSLDVKEKWPIGFSFGGGLNYSFLQTQGRNVGSEKIVNSWINNSLGFSGFFDMTYLLLRSDFQIGFNNKVGHSSSFLSSFGVSSYLKFPYTYKNRKIWLYFPTVGLEWMASLGNKDDSYGSQGFSQKIYLMLGLSGDFEVWQDNFFLKPSLLFGLNTQFNEKFKTELSSFKVVLGLEIGWRFLTLNT